MKAKKSFTITAPTGSVMLSLAVGIVYDAKTGWETLGLLYVLGTILENFL
jgi:hypothetical protein